MKEIWKDIKGFEGKYQVSNLGKVKSLDYGRTGKEKVMKGVNDGCGYLKVKLCLNGCKNQYRVNRLVAETFLSNPNNLPYVNHKDGNKTNNSVENLEWCTPKQNVHHACNTGLHPKKLVPIHCNELNMDFDSICEAARYFGCSDVYIHKILNGKYKSKLYKKYTFTSLVNSI